MRYCSNCGKQNDNDAKFCSGCGTMLETVSAEETVKTAEAEETATENTETVDTETVETEAENTEAAAPAPAYQTPQQTYTPYQAPASEPEGISAKGRTFGIIGFILGIVAVAFCWLGILPVAGLFIGFVMVACAVVGLIFCNISRKEGYFKLANIGKVFSIIGICLTGICWIIGFGVSSLYITQEKYSSPNYYNEYFNDIGDIDDISDIGNININDINDINEIFK